MNTAARLLLWIGFVVLTGCANTATLHSPVPLALFNDAGFRASATPASGADLFTVSPAMRAYLNSPRFRERVRQLGPEKGLVDALYQSGELKLEYDASQTRNAAETYQAKMGNCLSLVIMTAAFAKELNMVVQYQDVAVAETWTRAGGLYFANTHVNIAFGRRSLEGSRGFSNSNLLLVDFLPPPEAGTLHSTPIDEDTIVAMYMNNRAAELMSQNRLDDAYWWARNSLARYPDHPNAFNTLGVIYQRHGDLALAEQAYKAGLQREPDNLHLMHNLVPVLTKLGKDAEARSLAARLATLDPTPSFMYFNQGVAAMEKGNYKEAKALFSKEVRRAPDNHEFHFWLAIAEWRLGEATSARDQMALAVETSNTQEASARYSAKLAHLRALVGQRQY